MRRFFRVFMIVVMLINLVSVSFADGIRVPIDLRAMDMEELLSLADELSVVLAEHGYSYGPKDTEAAEKTENQPEEKAIEENADDNAAVAMDEGAKELSDETFLEDLAAGLTARWSIPDKDTSIMSDKQFIEYYSQFVNSELVYLNKYAEYSFKDETLGEYATGYIAALQSQFVAITEYYGVDEKLYNEYWSVNGYRPRSRYVYLINKAYGLNIPDTCAEDFSDISTRGEFYNILIPNTLAIEAELSKLDPELSAEGKYLYILPFNFPNSSSKDITSLTVKANFHNSDDVIVDSETIISYEDIEAGKAVSTRKVSTSNHFDHISYSYSFRVETSKMQNTYEGTIIPSIQYSWDGALKKNGELASGQPVLEIDNLLSGWDYNSSWIQTLYVPYLKFDIRNTGTGDANSVTVRCVFTNAESMEIWDEETTYVVGSSDSPLKPGYSKKAFVYASVGYKTDIGFTPELSVDIYINDQLMDTIVIK